MSCTLIQLISSLCASCPHLQNGCAFPSCFVCLAYLDFKFYGPLYYEMDRPQAAVGILEVFTLIIINLLHLFFSLSPPIFRLIVFIFYSSIPLLSFASYCSLNYFPPLLLIRINIYSPYNLTGL